MAKIASILIVLLAMAAGAHADVIAWTCADDGDGAVTCIAAWAEAGDEYELNITGNQYWAPGHILGDITTDTALDPTIRVRNMIDNDSAFVWSGYRIDVAMGNPFFLSLPTVYSPGDWMTSITQQPTLLPDGKYHGIVDFAAGTPIHPGDMLDVSYKMTFDGLTSYSYCQTLTPLPEPATLSLLLLGGMALMRRRKAV